MGQARTSTDVARLLDLSRYAEAETSARDLLGSDPESATLHRLLAAALIGLDRPAEAVEEARVACRIAPGDPSCLTTLSRAAIEHGDVPLGLSAAQHAVTLAPHSAATHFSMCQALLASGSTASALSAADEVVRLAPAAASSHNLRGICLERAGRRTEARAEYRQALALDPQHALAINNLAAMDVLRNPLRAAQGFTAAAAVDPQQRIVQRNLVVATHNFVYQLRWVVLAGGLVEVALAYGGAPLWVRQAGLALLAGLLVAIIVRFARALPRGVRRSPRVLFSNLRGRMALMLLFLVFVGFLVVQVALGDAAGRAAGTQWLVELLVIGVAVAIWQRRRAGRRTRVR
jgi:Flp pilus assembly protein TadD